MSSSQKVVKIVSFVLFALGILDLVGAGFMIAGVGLTNGDTQGTAAMVAIMFFIMAAFNIVFAALGNSAGPTTRATSGASASWPCSPWPLTCSTSRRPR